MAPRDAIVNSTKGISKRLFGAYIFDWIAIIAIAAIAAGISNVTPHYHAFSVIDLSISYPVINETVSGITLGLVAGVAPAIIIFLIVLVFVPGPSTWRTMSRTQIFRWKLWEWNAGWLGLALTHATSQLITQGVKNVAGKPRPDMLARCNPDLNALAAQRVGGYGQSISPAWIMVDQTICQQTDKSLLDDGFRSFPSGHATTSWAGMLYLSLYLASKFSIWFPTLPLSHTPHDAYSLQKKESRQIIYRDEGAAPPTWLLFLIYIPLGVAIYITGTRFFDYYHFGFDLISGAVIGIISAWFSFRFYNLPLGRSAGWAWGPRSRDRAFAIGVGRHGWVSDDSSPSSAGVGGSGIPESQDIEMGNTSYAKSTPYQSSSYQPTSQQTDGIGPQAGHGPHGVLLGAGPTAGRWNERNDQYQEVRSLDGGFERPEQMGLQQNTMGARGR